MDDNIDEARNDISDTGTELEASGCLQQCCSDETKAFQPMDQPTLQSLLMKIRNFQQNWFKQFPWIGVCVSHKKALLSIRKEADAVLAMSFLHFLGIFFKETSCILY